MSVAIRALFDTMMIAQRDGWGAIFVLWVFVLAAAGAAALALRAYRSANDARIEALSERLDGCERKHAWQSQALEQARVRHDRLQRRLALVTGLLMSVTGSRDLPHGLLAVILDDEGGAGLQPGVAAAA